MARLTKKNFFQFLTALMVFSPFIIALAWPGQKVYFIACNVGQGDAILITKGFTQILIDGGPNSRVLDCLGENMPFWDKTLEMVINTHPEKDHMRGLIDVIERYNVELFVGNNIYNNSAVFEKFRQEMASRKIPVFAVKSGDKIKISGLKFTVLWPAEKLGDAKIWQENPEKKVLGKAVYKGNLNKLSLVLHFKYKQFDAILTGDIDQDIEKKIIQANKFNNIEVLKIAHHGSRYSTSHEFLEAVKPKIAVISVGKNPWGHPTKEVLERLNQAGIKILRTDKQKIKLKI